MRIVYFGSGAFGLPTLDALRTNHGIQALITQPDRPAGRGGKATATPIAARAVETMPDVPILKPGRLRDETAVIRAIEADAWVVIAYGQKLSPELLEGRFAVNLHASRLPRWRGAAPIHAAIVAGDAQTGVSVIELADRMDAGVIYGMSSRVIEPDQTAGDLHDLLAADGPAVVDRVLRAHAQRATTPIIQDESLVTLAPKLAKADGWVDFASDARSCAARINGLSPWPGVTASFRNEPLKILRSAPVSAEAFSTLAEGIADKQSPPGTVIDASRGLVKCGDGAISVMTVQPPGKKPMPWKDFGNGRDVKAHERLEGRESS